MKKLLLLIAVLWLAMPGQCQQNAAFPGGTDSSRYYTYVSRKVREGYLKKYGNDTANPDNGMQKFMRWDNFWSLRLSQSRDPRNSLFGTVTQALDAALREPQTCLGSGYRGNYTFLGPKHNSFGKPTDNSGRMVSIWVSPTVPGYILAGAGGLWKTTNGGQNWVNITDAASAALPGTMGVTNIAVDPQNNSRIVISTGTMKAAAGTWQGAYGLGLMYSTDAGNTWQADQSFRTVSGTVPFRGWTTEDVKKLAYSPFSNGLYALYDRRILFKGANTAVWQDITPPLITNMDNLLKLTDFHFTNGGAGKVLFATTGPYNSQLLAVYDETTHQWVYHDVVFPVDAAYPNIQNIYDIALTPDNQKIYWLASFPVPCGTCDEPNKLYTSNITGGNVQIVNNYNTADDRTALGTARILSVSPTNGNVIYVGNGTGYSSYISRSGDGGRTFSVAGKTHADCRGIFFAKGGSPAAWHADEVVYTVNDGGVQVKRAWQDKFISITGEGLNVAMLGGLSSDPVNTNQLLAGVYDNGGVRYIKGAAVPWHTMWEGDGFRPAFKKNGVPEGISQSNFILAGRYGFTNGTNEPVSLGISNPTPQQEYRAAFSWMRPLKIDKTNTVRYGIHFIWKQNAAGNWEGNFGNIIGTNMGEPKLEINRNTMPLNYNALAVLKNPADFELAPNDPNVAYIAYGHIVWDAQHAASDLDNMGTVYRSKNLTAGHTWQDVSPFSNGAYGIPCTDIELDPVNPARVWVCYGGVKGEETGVSSANRTRRVFFSENYGDSWVDKSAGLPATPVLKLLYIEGTNDLLFAATDLGVYKWNTFRQRWECFQNGMPKCIVTDMEMNYCTGKLRVSTFGRGIWETDIAADMNGYTPGFVHNITTNTTWSSSKTINGSIKVAANKTLTISGANTTIYMPHKGKIQVEPKGRLVIDGATITNNCDGAIWYGIEVAGNPNLPEIPANQGVLVLKNGASLQHARVAISNFDLPAYRCGGIVLASNSSIRNCIKATSFNYTNYSYTDGSGNSTCSFDQVSFIKDDPKYAIDQGGYFAAWNIAGGMRLRNCKFLYDLPLGTLAQKDRYSAISLQSTKVRIENCTFEGFRKGVYATDYKGLPQRRVYISQNTFTKNAENIILGGNSYGVLNGNLIKDMVPISAGASAYGIYLDNTQGAELNCNNRIEGVTNLSKFGGYSIPVGLVVNNTSKAGEQWGAISKRTAFSGLFKGTQIQGNNRYLSLTCNDFSGCYYGILASSVNGNSGIVGDQGTGCDGGSAQANNTFSNNTRDIRSSSFFDPWKYYAGAGPGQMPPNSGGPSLTVVPACGSNHRTDCNERFPIICYSTFTTNDLLDLIDALGSLTPGKPGYEMEEQLLFSNIVSGFNELNDVAGLQSFLEETEEAQDNERCRRLLIPMYVQQQNPDAAIRMISKLQVDEAERQAFMDYYTLVADIDGNNRKPDALTDGETEMLVNIAESDFGVAPFAKSLLEWGRGIEWPHPVDDTPIDMAAAASGSNAFAGSETGSGSGTAQGSRLMDASPNPAKIHAVIKVFITGPDSYKKPMLSVKNVNGKQLYKQALKNGWNEVKVPVRNWRPGIYFYSLSISGKTVATKKLSVIR